MSWTSSLPRRVKTVYASGLLSFQPLRHTLPQEPHSLPIRLQTGSIGEMNRKTILQNARLSLRTASQPQCGVRLAAPFTRALSIPSEAASSSSSQPWFVEDTEPIYAVPKSAAQRQLLPLSPDLPPLPSEVPNEIKTLHAALALSPHLEPSALLVRKPIPTPMGPPPLEDQLPKGRRKRGRTYVGEGVRVGTGYLEGDIWNWIVLAQVRNHNFFVTPYFWFD